MTPPPSSPITPVMWSDVIERIAVIEEAVRRQDEREEEMQERQKEILASVQQIERFIAQINGGAKALFWVGGAFAAIGSLATWIASYVHIPWKQ